MYDYWEGMPPFNQEKKEPYLHVKIYFKSDDGCINLRFDSKDSLDEFNLNADTLLSHNHKSTTFESRNEFSCVAKQAVTEKTKSAWYPFKPHKDLNRKIWNGDHYQPDYPIYIVSKGRWHNALTTKALAEMNLYHYIIVERSEYSQYLESANSFAHILILPELYLYNYDTCDSLGSSKSKGPGAARNFAKDHSVFLGEDKHWVMDDNLDAFHYLTDNKKQEVRSGFTLCATEDFVGRYSNVPVAGLNYYSFCKSTDKVPPVVFNTRIYSCLLIDNSFNYEWRGRYNEDTDLSLRVLKDGLCTIQMNAFLCGKVTTQRMRGGNSKEFYDNEGTKPKSQMIEDLHPDVAKVVWRFNRWHHHVNYKPFKNNKPILNEDYVVKKYNFWEE